MPRRLAVPSALLLLVVVLAEIGGAADPAPPAAPGKYFGASSCDASSCHSRPEPRKDSPALQEYTTCTATEQDGIPRDRHSFAYKRLKSKEKGGDERSAEIMAKLNAAVKSAETAQTSERCLTCHGVAVADYGVGRKNPGVAVGKHSELQGKGFRADDGVSCDGCHCPAEKRFSTHDKKGWISEQWTKLGGKAGGSEKL